MSFQPSRSPFTDASLEPMRQPQVWPVGALCLAVADALAVRFSAVTVEGELAGLTRAASGHMYFTLKDASGQLRCAMFRRAAQFMDFRPVEGDRVIVQGRVSVYEARGDLQLVVESMRRSGAGNLFEQFLRIKAELEQQGLFDAARKRQPVALPRGIAVVTSLQAAALQDVLTALGRRAPHVPVLIVPALVQGAGAAASLSAALQQAYASVAHPPSVGTGGQPMKIDTILLVRGGGGIEDLWAFNDATLARTIAASPVPVIAGIGHETDFTIADLTADMRAPTPTAAAEMAALVQPQLLERLQRVQERLAQALDHRLLAKQQALTQLARAAARPSIQLARHEAQLEGMAQRLQLHTRRQLAREEERLAACAERLPHSAASWQSHKQHILDRAALRLDMLNPQRVLERGYAVVSTASGEIVRDASVLETAERLVARVARGSAEVEVRRVHAEGGVDAV